MHERALDPLAGGIFREGHQCGMLWGACLATAAEAYRRCESLNEARALALHASAELIASFEDQNHSIACREITGVKMNSFFGLLKFMIETMVKGMDNSTCFMIAEKWTPKALEASERGLQKDDGDADVEPPAYNCAALVASQWGATNEETVLVAGFAGGMGLSGEACGGLAAAIWLRSLKWLKEHPGEELPMFRFPAISKCIADFKKRTGGHMRCKEICGRHFNSAKDHSDFILQGGCQELIDWLGNRTH